MGWHVKGRPREVGVSVRMNWISVPISRYGSVIRFARSSQWDLCMTRDTPPAAAAPVTRSDARRNKQALLDAAAAVFVRAGVDAPIRQIAAEAGVGLGTLYRHFPTRADLV